MFPVGLPVCPRLALMWEPPPPSMWEWEPLSREIFRRHNFMFSQVAPTRFQWHLAFHHKMPKLSPFSVRLPSSPYRTRSLRWHQGWNRWETCISFHYKCQSSFLASLALIPMSYIALARQAQIYRKTYIASTWQTRILIIFDILKYIWHWPGLIWEVKIVISGQFCTP